MNHNNNDANNINRNYSNLHRFLHWERLRQTVYFLREHKKEIVRARIRKPLDVISYAQSLITSNKSWRKIKEKYSYLTDAYYLAVQNMHLCVWAPREQKEFITAMMRQIVKMSSRLDAYQIQGMRQQQNVYSFPLIPKENNDDVLKKLTREQLEEIRLIQKAAQAPLEEKVVKIEN
jgi:hypothetical protein